MRLLSAALILGVFASPAFADPAKRSGPTLAEAEETFNERCYMCHVAEGGAAPQLDQLAALDPAAIVEKLTTGTMAALASGISAQQKREIAVFLTQKPLPASGDLPAVSP